MKRLTLFMGLLLFLAPLGNATLISSWKPLLTPTELHSLLQAHPGFITLVDIRALDASTPDASYNAGHLPFAVSSPYATWRGQPDNPGQLVSQEKLTWLVQALGVEAETPVVVIHQGHTSSDFGAAARVYWNLKSAGLQQLALLNGGFLAWKAAGLPISQEAHTPLPSDYPAQFQPQWRATTTEVEQLLQQETVQLLDARPVAFFEGHSWHTAAARPGTIAGAEDFDNQLWFQEGGPQLASRDTIAALIREHQLGQVATTVSFCNTGHWAATNWFVLSELGNVPGVKLYPESLVEWSARGLPMTNVPGRLEWAWRSTQQWLTKQLN